MSMTQAGSDPRNKFMFEESLLQLLRPWTRRGTIKVMQNKRKYVMDASTSHHHVDKSPMTQRVSKSPGPINKETQEKSKQHATSIRGNQTPLVTSPQRTRRIHQHEGGAYLCKCKKSRFPFESCFASSCLQRQPQSSFRPLSSLLELSRQEPFRRWWASFQLSEAYSIKYECVDVYKSLMNDCSEGLKGREGEFGAVLFGRTMMERGQRWFY